MMTGRGDYIPDLRVKRLLLLAQKPKWHKRFYSQYYWLQREGLIDWVLGTAFLTPMGIEYLEMLQDVHEYKHNP